MNPVEHAIELKEDWISAIDIVGDSFKYGRIREARKIYKEELIIQKAEYKLMSSIVVVTNRCRYHQILLPKKLERINQLKAALKILK